MKLVVPWQIVIVLNYCYYLTTMMMMMMMTPRTTQAFSFCRRHHHQSHHVVMSKGLRSFQHRQHHTVPATLLRATENMDDTKKRQEIMANRLLGAALRRARSTLLTSTTTTTTDNEDSSSSTTVPPVTDSIQDLLDSAVDRASTRTIQDDMTTKDWDSSARRRPPLPPTKKKQRNNVNNNNKRRGSNPLNYRENPAITNTALAQVLWASILRPHVDTAIDATCGNGHDSVALARLLFPTSSSSSSGELSTTADDDHADSLSRLICIDIQERACQTTRRALGQEFSSDFLLQTGQIQVLQTSHAPLPMEWALQTTGSKKSNDKVADKARTGQQVLLEENLLSVALVVYNLGWLPSNSEGTSKEDGITQMDTTLQSMVDAMLLLRIGGMISVTTYPRSNAPEDGAVRTFLECAALLSSNVETWQGLLQQQEDRTTTTTTTTLSENENDNDDDTANAAADPIVRLVQESMERLVAEGDACQTWRVSEHRKLGMDRAPILLTATRIK